MCSLAGVTPPLRALPSPLSAVVGGKQFTFRASRGGSVLSKLPHTSHQSAQRVCLLRRGDVLGAALVLAGWLHSRIGTRADRHAGTTVLNQAPAISRAARAFVDRLLRREWRQRCKANEALSDPWLNAYTGALEFC